MDTSVVCGTCERTFEPPTKPALDDDWEPKPWHEEGYCCKKCFQDKDKKRSCKACGKTYTIPTPNPLAKRAKKPKAWHEDGYCSKKCMQDLAFALPFAFPFSAGAAF